MSNKSNTFQQLDGWRFKMAEDTDWLPAHVPGCVHTDLLKNGRIPDPFYGANELDLQWIDKKNWDYEVSFAATPELLAESKQELFFEGLDTYADVFLNGRLVLNADNMFRTWKVDVTGQLMPNGNTLTVRFRSPIVEDVPKLEKLGFPLPAPNDTSEMGGLGDKKISVFARKAPYHYGWDWGPRFVTSGIWRPVTLIGWSESRITDLYLRQDDIRQEAARLTAVVEVEAEQNGEAILRIEARGQEWTQTVELKAGISRLELPLVIKQPSLWWCRGLGEPNLYTFRAELSQAGKTTSEHSVRTGLRTIRLIREREANGTSFYVEVNGQPVFSRGANHIPNDSFVSEVTADRYRHEIAAAVESNLNMIRVWGGGIYEDKIFYDLCDEAGLLVWQDFMFACSMYPGDEAFLASVKAEAEDNVKRLRNHASIALWCGNNEIDSAWAHFNENSGWGWKNQHSPERRETIWSWYEELFHRMLPHVVERLMPGTDYWPSSPLVELTGDIRQHTKGTPSSGDIHYWGVWHSKEPFERYNEVVGRFMSEYGFQSFPEYKSALRYAEPEDMELESKVMQVHQKNGQGNLLIKEYMEQYLHEPKDFPSFLYLSQVLQADAMAIAIEAHRRNKPYCMGSLYWQLNDCWPVASWASMDYYGHWKAAQYHIKRSFRDVIVSAEIKNGLFDIKVVSDRPEPFEGQVRLRLMDFQGAVVRETCVPVHLAANEAVEAIKIDHAEWPADKGPEEVLLLMELLEDNQEVVDAKTHYFVRSRHLRLEAPVLKVTESKTEDGSGTRITMETDKLARQVWLYTEKAGIFTDNFFDLVPGIPVTVDFLAHAEGTWTYSPADAGQVEVFSMTDFIRLGESEVK